MSFSVGLSFPCMQCVMHWDQWHSSLFHTSCVLVNVACMYSQAGGAFLQNLVKQFWHTLFSQACYTERKRKTTKTDGPCEKDWKTTYIYFFFLQDIEHWSQSLLLLAMYRKQWFFYTNNFLQNIWIHRHLLHGCLMHAHICRWLLCKGILVPTFMPLCDTFLRLFL